MQPDVDVVVLVYVFRAHVAAIIAEFCSFRLDLCVHAFGGKNSFLVHVVTNSAYCTARSWTSKRTQ
jgi:hypothetical protein